MGDLGGYGIGELPPTGPLFARGPYRALGQKGNPWEVVRNSISTHVTHAEITHFQWAKNSQYNHKIAVIFEVFHQNVIINFNLLSTYFQKEY